MSFALTDQMAVNGWVRVSPSGQRLTTAMAVVGPNASGKTSLIQPLAFLGWFVPFSFNSEPDSGIPIIRHFTSPENAPTEFEVIADGDEPDTVWRYQLSVNHERVLTESVHSKVRRGAWRPIFERRWSSGRYEVTQDGFGLDPGQAAAVRPNVSLISWAAQYGVPFAKRLSSFSLLTNMNSAGRMTPRAEELEQCAAWLSENEAVRTQLSHLLSQWDLGLADIVIRKLEFPDSTGSKQPRWFPYGIHTNDGKRSFELPFFQESSGTRAAFTLLSRLLSALATGGVVAYDELESDLHPMMLPAILELFENPETNPNNAQIIFTCHVIEVLRLLQKSQVMLVEKDGLESHAWRLDTVEGVRSDDNRVAKYLAGAYGAVPRL